MKDKVFSGHQPNFVPYMGVFYKMFKSDVFVLDDDVQYSSKGLHNANFLKIDGKKHRITVPVNVEYGQKINEVRISYERKWDVKMLKTIYHNYRKASHFDETYEMIERIFGEKYEYIADLNTKFIKEISERLGIGCKIVIASEDVPTSLTKNERNVYQCLELGCGEYYSGEGGRAYNDEDCYEKNGLKITYTDYTPVSYRQQGDEFIENLSVLDYLMNEGFSVPKCWR